MRRGIVFILLILVSFLPTVARGYHRTPIGESDVIDRVIVAAPDTLIAREDLGQVKSNLIYSKSIFDTNTSGSVDYTRDEFQRESNFFGTREDTANWNIGVAKKLPIGTSTSLDWSNERSRIFGAATIGGMSVFPSTPEYESILRFSVSQPMMKNFAGMNDRAVVDQAKKSLAAADLGTKYKIALVAHRALSLYWRWVLSIKYIASRTVAITDAQNFLNITLERARLGTAEQTDVLAARANFINRRNGLLRARRRAIRAEKDLKIVLGYEEYEKIEPRNKRPYRLRNFYSNKDEAISAALANRWDYLAKKRDVEKYDIRMISAKNKRWPELDVISTLAVNGLTTSYSSTMSNVDHPNWTVGMTVSFPLENRAARGEYKKAGHEKSKAVIELKKKENDISNQISELLSQLKIESSILSNAQTAERIQTEKLKEELEKYGMGRSNSELVILYQDDKIYSEIATLESWGDYIQTILDLRLAENTLIDL